ncbi:MAG: ATP-dependent Clp protease ATP-binding protein, partial [Pedosphaera sp.]|nr:ATP-dependent Clp protease ATP-binding protein [Pedosphaera sp.]
WRIEGLNGLAMGSIGWCHDPYTTPSTIQYATKGQPGFEAPVWPESWFPDAFIGTMAELLIALEKGTQPTISGRDNLKTMALVDAAYLSAKEHRAVMIDQVARESHSANQAAPAEKTTPWWKLKFPIFNQTTPLNFTRRATQVLALARKEADRFRHNFVGTEHLILGMIKLGQGTSIQVLNALGADLETVRKEVEKRIGSGVDEMEGQAIPYTPRVKKVLALAAREAKILNHTYVGTEHILLGLLREGGGIAASVLKSLGINLEQTRAEVLKGLDSNEG